MVAADEMGWNLEFGGVRVWIPRTRVLFGRMCIPICQRAVGLGDPVDGESGHLVSAAKMAGSKNGSSVRGDVEWCGENSKLCSFGISARRIVLRKRVGSVRRWNEGLQESIKVLSPTVQVEGRGVKGV